MLEGNFLRTAITSGEHKQTWPLCVPRRDVSLPGCALNDVQKTKIYKQLAKEFSTGNLKGTFKENFGLVQNFWNDSRIDGFDGG